jgi:hypothetical protein
VNDDEKTRKQLLAELAELRRRVAELEAADAELQQTKKMLAQVQQKYHLLAASRRPLLWRCDAGGALVECNHRWYEYTGQTPKEALGMGWTSAVHPDDKEELVNQMFLAADTGNYQAEYRLRRAADGSYRWHMARGRAVIDRSGKVVGWLGSAIDIHDQKQVEEAVWKRGLSSQRRK